MHLLTALIPLADWNGPGWWVVFFPIGWFVFFLAILLLFRRVGWWGCGWGGGYGRRHGRRGWAGGSDPLEVLDRRFAEGAIDAEEHGARRRVLERQE